MADNRHYVNRRSGADFTQMHAFWQQKACRAHALRLEVKNKSQVFILDKRAEVALSESVLGIRIQHLRQE